MAPVTRGVTNTQEDRLVEFLGLGERFWTPWKPVDRIVLVLQKVGARFIRQAIGHCLLPSRWRERIRHP